MCITTFRTVHAQYLNHQNILQPPILPSNTTHPYLYFPYLYMIVDPLQPIHALILSTTFQMIDQKTVIKKWKFRSKSCFTTSARADGEDNEIPINVDPPTGKEPSKGSAKKWREKTIPCAWERMPK